MEPKLKVFLSSAQFEEEFKIEREGLPIIFEKEPLRSLFTLWEIESFASPASIQDFYSQNVINSDILLLLLCKSLRPAVKNEYQLAKQHKKDIFCFIRNNGSPNADLLDFINNEVRQNCGTTGYSTFRELCSKLENSFFQHYFRKKTTLEAAPNIAQHSKSINTDEKALRILVGIIDSEPATTIREQVLTTLFIECLSLAPEPINISECYEKIAQTIKMELPAIKQDLNKITLSLTSAGKIVSPDGIMFTLSTPQRTRISTIDKNIDEQEKNILADYYKKHKSKLPMVSFDYYSKILRDSISNTIYATAYSNASVRIIGDNNPISYDSEEMNRLILSFINQIKPTAGDISIWQEAISDVLSSKNSQVISWINRSYKAYWSLAALGLDPDCTKYKFEQLKDYCIYIDSHIIIRALVEAGSESKLCSDIISIGQYSGVDMRISESIYQEVEKSFDAANKAFYSSGQDIYRALDFFKKLHKKCDILEGFMREKGNNRFITWEQYLNRFYSPSNQNKLRLFIEKELGIKTVEDSEFEIEEWGEINELVDLLLKKRGKSFLTEKRFSESEKNDQERQMILRTNEARQMAIVYQMRQKGEGKGQFWFITFDEFIYKVSIDLANSGNQFYRFPCYMKPARWLEILVHSSQEPLDINTFREILMSPTFQHVADNIESEVISEMLEARVDQSIKDISTLRNMFTDIVSRPAVQDAYNEVLSASTGSSALKASEKVKDKIISAMADEMDKLKDIISEKDAVIITVKKEKEKQTNKASYFKAQLGRVQKQKNKNK